MVKESTVFIVLIRAKQGKLAAHAQKDLNPPMASRKEFLKTLYERGSCSARPTHAHGQFSDWLMVS